VRLNFALNCNETTGKLLQTPVVYAATKRGNAVETHDFTLECVMKKIHMKREM